jgi:hypothetical protein
MTEAERDNLRAQEDEVVKLTDGWTRSFQLCVYEVLNRRHNCKMDGIESERLKAFKKETGNEKRD